MVLTRLGEYVAVADLQKSGAGLVLPSSTGLINRFKRKYVLHLDHDSSPCKPHTVR
jgi:hypothetical protein